MGFARVAWLVMVLLLAGCTRPAAEPSSSNPVVPSGTTQAPAQAQSPTLLRGIAVSPLMGDTPGFFTEARALGDLVLWGGSIEQLADPKAAPATLTTYAHQKGLKMAIQTSPFVESGPAPEMNAELTASVAAFAERHHPEYLALGVEVNRFVVRDHDRFEAFVAWYDATYDAVKRRSPDVKVFVTFQYEWMEGHQGGLFGGPSNATPQWDLYGRFSKLDIAAFTTYPGLVETDPANLSDAYYARLATLSRTFAITETAHYADAGRDAWASSPAEQAAYASAFLARMRALSPEFVVWLHAYDQPAAPVPFRHMGLSDENGTARPARAVWMGG